MSVAVGLPTLPVDRQSERWQRIRAACHHAADYLDLDRHADHVWMTVEAFQNSTGRVGSPSRASDDAATGGEV